MLKAAPSARAPAVQTALRRTPNSRGMTVAAQAAEQSSTAAQEKKELQLIGPEPQRFNVAKGQLKDIASAAFPFLMRLGSGGFTSGYSVSLVPDDGKYAVVEVFGRKLRETSAVGSFKRPVQQLVLYEFEGCPFCRKVREAVAILDLDVLFLPCPKDGPTWRREAIEKGGKRQFPYLIDPNAGVGLYESDAIIEHLFKNYGNGQLVPLGLRLGPLTAISCGLAMLPRFMKGSAYKRSKLPEKPLVYWGYESSPFCKVVREQLCELELPHLYRSCARGSPKRQELFEQQGRFQVPYLEDPNTGVAMFESTQIIKYLQETYGA